VAGPKLGAKSVLVSVSPAAELQAADRAAGRGGAGPALPFLGLALDFDLQRPEVWILSGHELLGGRFQAHGQFRRHHGQPSRTTRTSLRTVRSRQARCIHGVF